MDTPNLATVATKWVTTSVVRFCQNRTKEKKTKY